MKELSAVLDFIYEGEVQVSQMDLDRFLETAADLQVKGLTEDNFKPHEKATINQHPAEEEVKHEYNEVYSDASQPSVNLLQSYEEIPTRDSTQNDSKDLAVESQDTVDTINNGHVYSMIPEKDDLIMQFVNGVWKCTVCGKTDRKKSNITEHTEVHLEGAAHFCSYCGKTFKTKNSLRVHKYKTHTSDKFIEQLGHVV
eukprot:GFUD01140209.1.p1 GENE.GFUD01140209.1~~GFUD01140209.1.p1  ORF type:complete len:220 (+),score=33.32 GFUD01140209.1:69-662(+)